MKNLLPLTLLLAAAPAQAVYRGPAPIEIVVLPLSASVQTAAVPVNLELTTPVPAPAPLPVLPTLPNPAVPLPKPARLPEPGPNGWVEPMQLPGPRFRDLPPVWLASDPDDDGLSGALVLPARGPKPLPPAGAAKALPKRESVRGYVGAIETETRQAGRWFDGVNPLVDERELVPSR